MSGLTAGKKRFIKRKLCDENPTVSIGKSGASAELLKEIEKQLTKNKMVKAKILKSALSEHETKEVATTIAQQTSATLVEVRVTLSYSTSPATSESLYMWLHDFTGGNLKRTKSIGNPQRRSSI